MPQDWNKGEYKIPVSFASPRPGVDPALSDPAGASISPSTPGHDEWEDTPSEAYRYPAGGAGEEEAPVKERHTGRKIIVASVIGLVAVGGFKSYNYLVNTDSASIERSANGVMSGLLGRNHTSPPATEEAATPTVTAPTTTDRPTQTAKPTTTPPRPAQTSKAPAVIAPTVAACVEATPVELKFGQSTMWPVSASSDFAELIKLQKKVPTNWTVTNNVDTAKLSQLQNVYPGIRARYATNNEGAAATWFKIPGTAAQPSLADIEAGKVSGDELRLMITTNLTKLKSEGIFQNLAPVVDVATKAGQEKGRMFMTQEKADAYLKVYLEVAKEVGSVATVKHFAGGMTNGNTNTQEVVKTASYAELEKSGQLKPYALLNVKDNKHWAMMSSATTEGWPDAKLDNKQQSIFNPAAYAALNKLTGGNALIVTDAIGPNVAALKGMAVEKAIVNAWKAGANMALVSAPDTGKTISQQVTAGLEMTRSALQSGELKLDAFNESYLRIIGNKGLNACNVLKSYDEDGYAALIKSSPVPAPAATTAPVPPVTGTPTPGKSAIVSEKPTATATTTK